VPSYSAVVEIAAPPETVFARIADLEGHGEWSADPLEVTRIDDKTFRSVAQSKGKRVEATLEVVAHDPPRTFAFEATDLSGRWLNRFTVTPTAGGTRVVRSMGGRLTPAQLVLFWLVLFPVKRPNARRALERLKDLVERG
jgi:uncharacterized protein YndB with AHSA1/START domain